MTLLNALRAAAKGDKMTDKKDIEILVNAELARALEKYPLFSSPHEAYAVLLEECDELELEVQAIRNHMEGAWGKVKTDADISNHITAIYRNALYAAAEAIQVAAVCKKAIQSKICDMV